MNPAAFQRPEKPNNLPGARNKITHGYLAEYKGTLYLVEGTYESLLRIQKDVFLKGGYLALACRSIRDFRPSERKVWTVVSVDEMYHILYS